MGLRGKIILTISVLFALFALVSYMIQNQILYPEFMEYEEEIAKDDISRVIEAIENEKGHLEKLCIDWSSWDATYEFVLSKDNSYTEGNLDASTFENSELNLIHFIDVNNKKVFSSAYDYVEKKEITIVDFTKENWDSNHFLIPKIEEGKLLQQNHVSGIVKTRYGGLIVSSRLILKSNNQGPARGVMVMGRLISPIYERLKMQTKVDFDIVENYKSLFSEEELLSRDFIVKIENENYLRIYKGVRDIEGNIAYLISCKIQRDFSSKFLQTLRYSQYSIVVFTALVLLVLILILQFFFIKPVVDLKKLFRSIEENEDFSVQIPIERRDELGGLVKVFNDLLSTIDEKSKMLEDQARKDSLTGLYNRRHLDEHLKIEIGRALRQNLPCSVLLFDIDNFKLVNDTHGHDGGDYVLKSLSERSKVVLRQEDIFARYGGEEFVIILPNIDEHAAEQAAERMRSLVENLEFIFGNKKIPITISVGVATYPKNGNDVITCADKALYFAKETGRNRVIVFKS